MILLAVYGKAVELVKEARVYDYIVRSNKSLINLGVENPRIAVAGLNPHSGGHGLFGW